MEILAGLALGAALLYYWLVGHWFARVLMFIVLEAIALGLIVLGLLWPGFFVLAAILMGLAWWIASLPIAYWRKQSWAPAAASETFR